MLYIIWYPCCRFLSASLLYSKYNKFWLYIIIIVRLILKEFRIILFFRNWKKFVQTGSYRVRTIIIKLCYKSYNIWVADFAFFSAIFKILPILTINWTNSMANTLRIKKKLNFLGIKWKMCKQEHIEWQLFSSNNVINLKLQ